MTTSFDRATLLRMCTQVRPAIAVAAYIPALTHIQFDGKYATAYNDIMAVSVACEPGFKACVPGETLIKTLSSFKGEQVTLSCMKTTGADKLVLASGRSKITLPLLPHDKFPWEMPPAQGAEINLSNEIVWGIKTCLLSVGSDDKNPARMGVTLEASRDGKAVLFSTDGLTISRATTKSPIGLPGGVPIILPTAFCTELVALGRAYPEIKTPVLEVNPGSLVASFGDSAILYSKTIVDVEPLDFDKVLRKHFDPDKLELSSVPADMQESVGRAMLLLDEDPRINIAWGKGEFTISATTDKGTSEDVLAYSGKQFESLSINPTLVARALKTTNMLAFADTKCTVFGNDDRTFLHVVAHFSKGK